MQEYEKYQELLNQKHKMEEQFQRKGKDLNRTLETGSDRSDWLNLVSKVSRSDWLNLNFWSLNSIHSNLFTFQRPKQSKRIKSYLPSWRTIMRSAWPIGRGSWKTRPRRRDARKRSTRRSDDRLRRMSIAKYYKSKINTNENSNKS